MVRKSGLIAGMLEVLVTGNFFVARQKRVSI